MTPTIRRRFKSSIQLVFLPILEIVRYWEHNTLGLRVVKVVLEIAFVIHLILVVLRSSVYPA
jgi:hypothetical protein